MALPTWARLDLGSYATVELPVPGGSTLATTPVKIEGIGGDEFPHRPDALFGRVGGCFAR